MKTFMKQSKKGFTLIEMIVVIVVVAILAAISVPAVMKYIEEASDTKLIAKTQPMFFEAQVITTELYGKYGTKGTLVAKPDGSSTGEKTEILIFQEIAKKFTEFELIEGFTFPPDSVVVFFDDMNRPETFDTTKSTHTITKIAFRVKDEKYNLITIVFRPNETARVFKSSRKGDNAEIYCDEGEWCITGIK